MTDIIELEDLDVQEHYFDKGWTDGLPIVPPTIDRVAATLAAGGLDADAVLGVVAERGAVVVAEHLAVNAVMAGCKPEYFPIVVAAASAILDRAFNPHGALTSSGGSSFCVVVSGPMSATVGMTSRHNVLATGNRANATIGRALRLLAINTLSARAPQMDGTSIGHPGKFTFCMAEDPPLAPWEPLRVELGFGVDDTTVTVLPAEGPRQVANHLNASAEGILRTFAAAMRSPSTLGVGRAQQVILVFGPEHARACVEQGWTRTAVREFLCRESRVLPSELEAAGIVLETDSQHDMRPGNDGRLPTVSTPEDIFLVTAGGSGAGWSACIPSWSPVQHARAVTRRVARPGDTPTQDVGSPRENPTRENKERA